MITTIAFTGWYLHKNYTTAQLLVNHANVYEVLIQAIETQANITIIKELQNIIECYNCALDMHKLI